MNCNSCSTKQGGIGIDQIVGGIDPSLYPDFQDGKKVKYSDYYSENIYTWCTNCGNYGIHGALKRALVEESVAPKDALLCFDIGCNGNGSDKIDGYRFHGLHGRIIPFAAGASIANPEITIVASGGDGATMGEGVNHLIHAIRSNYNITFILHNNSNYGLTTGQASATTRQGDPRTFAKEGIAEGTINVSQLALSVGASFYARGFSGNVKQLTHIIRAGLQHKGFSFIEVLQNCPTYNKETPHQWYMQRVYDVAQSKSYDPTDLCRAKEVSCDLENRIATGVIYRDPERADFYSRVSGGRPRNLTKEVAGFDISSLLEQYR